MNIENIEFDASLNMNILDKLSKYIPYENGVFFEAGANEGTRQSNTYLLEKNSNWKGILVEPSQYYNLLSRNRPNSIAFNCALVSYDWKEPFISGSFGDVQYGAYNLMSKTEESSSFTFGNSDILVKAMTIDDVISSTPYESFDLISLDCEGSEFSILNGFNFDKHKTKFFLIETFVDTVGGDYEQFNKIHRLLKENGYELEAMLSSCDWLFKNKNY